MSKNIIVFDLETKNAFDEVGGRSNFSSLQVSVVGAYSYLTGEYQIFEEKEIPEFEKILQKKPLIVGFNSRRFDTVVLQPYIHFDLKILPQLDIMEEITKTLGHRVSLDSVSLATLGRAKTGSGMDAIRFWKKGEIKKLKSYCLEDVRITKEIYEYGALHGELFYTPKFGSSKARVPVNWKIMHPDEKEKDNKQRSLF
jgi:DEAD/DEAH box helicase domain-containing protein